eukprot:COSAG06_NODE_25534_length_634_cov_1.500935_1_plen_104_part_00
MMHMRPLQENGTLLSFSYVCPEPVLAKGSYLYLQKWTKSAVFSPVSQFRAPTHRELLKPRAELPQRAVRERISYMSVVAFGSYYSTIIILITYMYSLQVKYIR